MHADSPNQREERRLLALTFLSAITACHAHQFWVSCHRNQPQLHHSERCYLAETWTGDLLQGLATRVWFIEQILTKKFIFLCMFVIKLCFRYFLSVKAFVEFQKATFCVCQVLHLFMCENSVPLLAAEKVFLVFSKWVHCLALQSPNCGSFFSHWRNTFKRRKSHLLFCFFLFSNVPHSLTDYKIGFKAESHNDSENNNVLIVLA